MKTATDEAVDAATAARAGFAAFTSLPTPAKVSTVVGSYVDALQLYRTMLTSTPLPAPARAAGHALGSQLRLDILSFETINGLPPAELGAYLQMFFSRTADLQTAMGAFERALQTTAHHTAHH
jgi:hypothetical protein